MSDQNCTIRKWGIKTIVWPK